MILKTRIDGKLIKMSIVSRRKMRPTEDVDESSQALSVGDVIVEDRGKGKTIIWGTIEYKGHYVWFFRRRDCRTARRTGVSTVLAYAMQQMLDDYLRNRDSVSWKIYR